MRQNLINIRDTHLEMRRLLEERKRGREKERKEEVKKHLEDGRSITKTTFPLQSLCSAHHLLQQLWYCAQ